MSRAASDQTLIDEWRAFNQAHARVLDALDRALEGAHGVSSCELDVLQRLAAADGALRMHDLCECVQRSQSALSRMVGRLEDKGYVTRKLCPDDRRGVSAKLTEAGRECAEAARATQERVLAETLPTRPA